MRPRAPAAPPPCASPARRRCDVHGDECDSGHAQRSDGRDTATAAAPSWPCLSARGAAVRLEISAAPNARRTCAAGVHDGALRVRVAAPPADGRANALLLDWLASELGVPRRAIRLLRGESARRKTIEIGAAPSHVERWLALSLGDDAGVT